MVVLNWSWLRMVIMTSWPAARLVRGVANTVKRARPPGVRNRRSRTALGRANPSRPRTRTLNSSNPGITAAMWSRMPS